jgi:hypothetical protein
MAYLVTSRPTAVNISDAAQKLEHFVTDLKSKESDVEQFKARYLILNKI